METKNNINYEDGIYLEVFAIKDGIIYKTGKVINLKDASKILTNSLIDGIEKICNIGINSK